jgi:integrase
VKDILPTKPKSEKKLHLQLGWWKQELGSYFLVDITPALIGEKRDQLLGETTRFKKKRSNATVVRYLAALSHALSVAVKEWGWLDDTPMRKVRKPKESRGRVRFLSEIERKALLEACKQSENAHLYTIVVLALSTGMRKGEIMNLRWDDVNLKEGYIILHETKNGERRRVADISQRGERG